MSRAIDSSISSDLRRQNKDAAIYARMQEAENSLSKPVPADPYRQHRWQAPVSGTPQTGVIYALTDYAGGDWVIADLSTIDIDSIVKIGYSLSVIGSSSVLLADRAYSLETYGGSDPAIYSWDDDSWKSGSSDFFDPATAIAVRVPALSRLWIDCTNGFPKTTIRRREVVATVAGASTGTIVNGQFDLCGWYDTPYGVCIKDFGDDLWLIVIDGPVPELSGPWGDALVYLDGDTPGGTRLNQPLSSTKSLWRVADHNVFRPVKNAPCISMDANEVRINASPPEIAFNLPSHVANHLDRVRIAINWSLSIENIASLSETSWTVKNTIITAQTIHSPNTILAFKSSCIMDQIRRKITPISATDDYIETDRLSFVGEANAAGWQVTDNAVTTLWKGITTLDTVAETITLSIDGTGVTGNKTYRLDAMLEITWP